MDLLGIGEGIIGIGGKLIDKLIPDPDAKAKAQLELLRLQQSGELEELNAQLSVIKAEAQSNDPWTSRARPMFMYTFYFLLVALVVVAPVCGIFFPERMTAFFANVAAGFQAIPEALWWTFSAGYLGYSGARTFEKTKGVAK
jgi:hypothetical protein